MKRLTKMELLNYKKKELLLVNSLKLLKNKRDSLLNKATGSMSDSSKEYKQFSEEQDKLVSVFKKIFIKYPSLFLNLEALGHQSYFNIKSQPLHFLNLTWFQLSPDLNLSYFNDEFFVLSEEDTEELREAMIEFVNVLCSFSSLISNVTVLLSEIRRLTRRINFLDKTRLPIVRKEISKLEQALDESEREEIIRIKRIKESIIKT